jgi:hypothetical protein
MPSAYEIRAGGVVRDRKQSMADLKLRRLNELNIRLREDLDRPRIKVSEAATRCANIPPRRSLVRATIVAGNVANSAAQIA